MLVVVLLLVETANILLLGQVSSFFVVKSFLAIEFLVFQLRWMTNDDATEHVLLNVL